jgi:CheY-like chemotaxis protein
MAAPDRPSAVGHSDASGSAPHDHPTLDVLVVDPDGEVRHRCRASLSTAGLRVYESADGRDALAQVYSIKPHAIVLAAELPFIDGLELSSLLRREASTASIRIIGITSDDSPDHLRRFRDLGANVIFLKPVPFDELATAVRADTPAPLHAASYDGDTARLPAPRHMAKARLHERYLSKTPPERPPHLRCPTCDAVLQYEYSQIGGVNENHPEQWDYFVCQRHGSFQYRHRTRRLRPAS